VTNDMFWSIVGHEFYLLFKFIPFLHVKKKEIPNVQLFDNFWDTRFANTSCLLKNLIRKKWLSILIVIDKRNKYIYRKETHLNWSSNSNDTFHTLMKRIKSVMVINTLQLTKSIFAHIKSFLISIFFSLLIEKAILYKPL